MSGPDVIWANIGGLHGKQSGWCCTVKSTLRTKRDVAYLRKDGLPKEAIEALRKALPALEEWANRDAIALARAAAESSPDPVGRRNLVLYEHAKSLLARWDKLEEGE